MCEFDAHRRVDMVAGDPPLAKVRVSAAMLVGRASQDVTRRHVCTALGTPDSRERGSVCVVLFPTGPDSIGDDGQGSPPMVEIRPWLSRSCLVF
jgi:hypothetical protein